MRKVNSVLSSVVFTTTLLSTFASPGHSATAQASCPPFNSAFSYTKDTATDTMSVRPSCFGSKKQVGTIHGTYDWTACSPLSCSHGSRHATCPWSTHACSVTIRIPHPSTEYRNYTFNASYSNSKDAPVVVAGGTTDYAQCTSTPAVTSCS